MDMKRLLEAVTKFSGEEVGQKPGDQVRGTEKAKPTKSGKDHPFKGRLVGGGAQESAVPSLKDLSQLSEEQQIEWKLKEMWANFNEENIGVHPKRPGRKSDRHARGHEPEPRYKTIKTDEAVGQQYTVVIDRRGRERPVTGTIPELLDYFGYTLEVGKSYEHERGRYKINMTPKTIQQLVDNLNKAASNGAANGAASTYYSVGDSQLAEMDKSQTPPGRDDPYDYDKGDWHKGKPMQVKDVAGELSKSFGPSHYKWEITFRDGKRAVYHQSSPHYRDATAASDIEYILKSNPGAKVVAYKDDEPFDWESLLSEGWESGPPEYKEPYDDADDAYERHRQEKIDTEAEKEWAKLPKVSTYKLLGRGPNMEPNYEFDGKEYDTLEAAIEARKKLMADPKTPNPEHIGIQTLTRVVDKEQTDEAVQGGGHIKNLEDYTAKRDYIYKQLADPKQADNYSHFRQALFDLNRLAKEQGIEIEESRAHKQLATWFKNRELAQKYASGEVKIPTPQERQAQLKKLETEPKQVKEYGATSTGSPTSTSTDDVKKAMAATSTLKAATGTSQPAPLLMKAMDTISQGKTASATDMQVAQNTLQDINTAFKEPELANQLKPILAKANQLQQKK